MWGALIGAGASLLGGLFGGGSKKQETTTTNHVDYGRMVRDAEAAGFNPLTVLRNGGAAGFSVSTGTTPATPLSARLADGVAGATQSFLANFDPFKDQKREMEFKLVEAQLANLQADTSLKTAKFGQVPTYTAGNMKKTMGSGVAKGQTFKSTADILPASAGASQTPTVEKPTITNPWPPEWGMKVNPNRPDAEAFQTRYGESELMEMGVGLAQMTSDLEYNKGHIWEVIKRNAMPTLSLSSQKRKSLEDNYHPAGTNIYGLPAGQMPTLSSPRKYKQ